MSIRCATIGVSLIVLSGLILFSGSSYGEPRQDRIDDQIYHSSFSRSVPGQLNYQGALADASDSSAITATQEMTFRLFDSETKGAELWSETHPAVQVQGGLFQVLLGSVTAFPEGLFESSELWLQTEVGLEVLAPRKPLVSVAYSRKAGEADHAADADHATASDQAANATEAQHAAHADTAGWADEAGHATHADTAAYSPSTNPWMISGDDIYRETGNVGIGTNTPQRQLHITGANPRILIEASSSGPEVNFKNSDDSGPEIWALYKHDTTDDLRFYQGGDKVIIQDSTGNVGIGTTSPSTELDVNGTVTAVTYYGDGSNLTGISAAADSAWIISGNDICAALPGNVGIGTWGPTAKLDVRGDINAGYYPTEASYKIEGNTVLSVEGDDNTFVGVGAGENNSGSSATFLGENAGHDNEGYGNTFVGVDAGLANSTGGWNTFLGTSAGEANTEGEGNLFLGIVAGQNNETGDDNTYLGVGAGRQNVASDSNTFVGYYAGHSDGGSGNTFLGTTAGYYNAGQKNVFIGYRAGYNNSSESNKLIIANGAQTSDILIYGDFSSGDVGIGSTDPDARLEIQGISGGVALIKIDQRGTSKYAGLRLDRDDNEKWFLGMTDLNDNLTFRRTASSNYLVIDTTGKVGIGMQTPSYKLDVAGDINTTGEIRRNGDQYNHPDYVFEPGYELLPLEELDDYLVQNGHLPGMPSAEEVRVEGVKLFEQNRLLLEKLEESYLYIVELQKNIMELQKTTAELENTLQEHLDLEQFEQ